MCGRSRSRGHLRRVALPNDDTQQKIPIPHRRKYCANGVGVFSCGGLEKGYYLKKEKEKNRASRSWFCLFEFFGLVWFGLVFGFIIIYYKYKFL